jgi:hypothetical protein
MAFADEFRAVVVPDLRKLCDRLGLAVAYGNRDFLQAAHEANGEAHRRGSGQLPPRIQAELRDWIDTTIGRASERWRADVEAQEAMRERVFDANERWMMAWLRRQDAAEYVAA